MKTGEVTGSEVSPNCLVRAALPRLVIVVIRSLKSWQTIRYQTRIFCQVTREMEYKVGGPCFSGSKSFGYVWLEGSFGLLEEDDIKTLWGAACCCCSCCWNLYQGFINWGPKMILVYFLCNQLNCRYWNRNRNTNTGVTADTKTLHHWGKYSSPIKTIHAINFANKMFN